eukprot:jgi/Tetstr1/456235/TSEL_042998.t1
MALRRAAAATMHALTRGSGRAGPAAPQLAPAASQLAPSTSGAHFSSAAESPPVDFATLTADKQAYQKILEEARQRIFGTHIGDGLRSGRKVLRKGLAAEKMAEWYMPTFSQADPIFANPKDDQNKKKLLTLKRRGKGPPPKGQGKRAKKR